MLRSKITSQLLESMEQQNTNNNLLFKEESYKIIGAAMEVHRLLGCGFVEAIYQEALEKEFALREIPFEREKELIVSYKGNTLTKTFKALHQSNMRECLQV